MALPSFTGTSPAITYKYQLHICYDAAVTPAATLAAGCALRLGDGTAVPFSFTTTGISSPSIGIGSTNITTLLTEATAARTVTLADSSGKLYPSTTKVLSATVTTATASTTVSTLTDLSFTPDAGALYDFEATFLVQGNTATVGLTLALTGPTMDMIHCYAEFISAGAVAQSAQLTTLASGTPGTLIATTTVPVINTTYLVRVRGTYRVSSTTAALVPTLTAETNTASSNVSALVNSHITHTFRAA
jgi:hypothetical protein